jgi:hypothetical protein
MPDDLPTTHELRTGFDSCGTTGGTLRRWQWLSSALALVGTLDPDVHAARWRAFYRLLRLADELVSVRDEATGHWSGYVASWTCVVASGEDRVLEVPEPPEDQWTTIVSALAGDHHHIYLDGSEWYPDAEQPSWRLSRLEQGERP